MKLDLSQFRLKHNDGKIATLIHPHGHEFKVAINALHPLNRKNLDSLEKHPEVQPLKKMAKGGKLEIERIKPKYPVEAERIEEKPLEVEQLNPQLPKNPVEAERIKPKHPVEYEKMAEGGDVTDESAPMSVNPEAATQQPQVSPEQFNQNLAQAAPQIAPEQQQPSPQETAQQAPMVSLPGAPEQPKQAPPAPAPQAPVPSPEVQGTANQINKNAAQQQLLQNPDDPWGTDAMNQAAMQGLSEQKQGLALEAQGRKAEGKEIAAQGDAAVKASQEIQQKQNQEFDALKERRQHLSDDLANSHVDPQRYINSMSTGDKIQSAIGLILGGISGGGNGNPAMDFLNKQIDRDIDAQRAELGKKENLLAANLHDFGNLKDAMDFTRINHNDIISYQMKAAAARQMGTMGSAELLKQAGILDYNSAQLQGQMAMRKTLLSQNKAGGSQVSPESKIRALIPQGPEQDKHFKELAEAEKTIKTRDNLMSAFDKVAGMQTAGNRALNPIQSKSAIAALVEPLTAGMSKETAGRYTEQDAHAIKNLWPKLSDNAETVKLKRQQMERINNEKVNFPMLKSLGINPESFSQYQGNAEIKTLGGVKYQKVNGGWRKVQ